MCRVCDAKISSHTEPWLLESRSERLCPYSLFVNLAIFITLASPISLVPDRQRHFLVIPAAVWKERRENKKSAQ